jgi:hypothetical protein
VKKFSVASGSALPVAQWGQRLGDAIRATLASGDFERARRLAVEGDGQSRDLAREFTFMFRGLGITVRVLMERMQHAVHDAEASGAGVAAQAAACAQVLAFHAELDRALATAATGSALPTAGDVPVGAGLTAQVAATAALTTRAEKWFEVEQARIAAEVIAAMEQRDGGRAERLLHQKDTGQYLLLHDVLLRFMARSMAWVLETFGDAALLQFHLATAQAMKAGFEKWDGMAAREFAWTTAFLLKQHMGQVTVFEDESKFTFDQDLCGSGGRLRIRGAYEGRDALPFIEEPGPLTFGGERLPVYCSHCAVWNGTAPLRWFGHVHWVFESPARADGSCKFHLFKRVEDVPDDYTQRVAWPEPSGLRSVE